MVSRSAALALLVVCSGACKKTSSPQKPNEPEPTSAAPAVTGAASSSSKVQASVSLATPLVDRTPKIVPLAVCRAEGKEPLDAARKFYDENKFDEALSCAAQAAALSPDDD